MILSLPKEGQITFNIIVVGIDVTIHILNKSYNRGKITRKTSTKNLKQPGNEPGPNALKVVMLPLFHSDSFVKK